MASLPYAVARNSALLAFAGLIATLVWLSKTRRQKYIQGVPVIGGSDEESIKMNRVRFVQESKDMLQEGYKEVSI